MVRRILFLFVMQEFGIFGFLRVEKDCGGDDEAFSSRFVTDSEAGAAIAAAAAVRKLIILSLSLIHI